MTRLMIAALAAPLALFTSAALAAQTGDGEAARAEAVAEAITEHQRRFADAPPPGSEGVYQYVFDGLSTPTVPMSAFDGDVVLVVNTASRCGLTPQYEALQAIHGEYGEQGFSVVGVPSGDFREQELETAEEIREFCTLNFGVTFPMAGRTHVIGEDAHPFYRWAEAELGEDAVPQWNFHKLLVGRDGSLIAAFPSRTAPDAPEVRTAIEDALEA